MRVFATQYLPNTAGSVEVALPDKCAKFAALGNTGALTAAHCPSGYQLGLDYRVVVTRQSGQSATIPLKDVGPWNQDDNYWDNATGPRPRRLFSDLGVGNPEAQAAFSSNYNLSQNCLNLSGQPSGKAGGADQFGRCVLNPAGVDLSVAAASQLGLGSGQNEWVTISILWERGGKVPAGGTQRIHASTAGGATVMGNLTITQPDAGGFATVYPCADGLPLASNINYEAGQTVANFAAVHADANGDICVYTLRATHVIWDQVAQTTAFTATNARRLLDTRTTSSKVPAGGTQRIHASTAGGATVMGNLTITQPDAGGFATVYPCADGLPLASNINYEAGQTVANFAAVHADANGDICVYTLRATHVIWDQVAQTTAFTATNAQRLLDTRIG